MRIECTPYVLVLVPGKKRPRSVSNALRSGGKDAMRTPMDASADDQICKSVAVHVGSWVLVMALSSTVLEMEQIVALRGGISYVCIALLIWIYMQG